MAETIIEIPLDELHPFPDHPFGVRDDDMMLNSKEYGMSFGTLRYTRQITRNCVILRNGRSAKRKSTVVNDCAQFSVGTMRSHR